MANNAARYGFRPAGSMFGAAGVPQLLRGRIASAYQASVSGSVDLRPGDPLARVSDGTLALAAAGSTLIAGVVASILPFLRTSAGATYRDFGFQLPGGTTWTNIEDSYVITYWPAGGTLFEVDADENTTATTEAAYAAFIGENADHILTRDATHLWANPRLDISTHATTTATWRIVDLARYRSTDYSGERVKLIVTATEIEQAPWTTTGV